MFRFYTQRDDFYIPVYVAAAFLNPAFLDSDLFVDGDIDCTKPIPPNILGYLQQGIRYPRLFYSIFDFLIKIASAEAENGGRPEFTQWKGRASELIDMIQVEFMAYASGNFPFNCAHEKEFTTSGIIEWWQRFIGRNGKVLPHIAIKIFTMRVNSMADERTASTFSWMSSPLRNAQSVDTMGAKAMIYKYYRTEFPSKTKTTLTKTNLKRQKKLDDAEKLNTSKQTRLKKPEDSKAVAEVDAELVDGDDTWLDDKTAPDPMDPISRCNTASLLGAAKFVNPKSSVVTSALPNPDGQKPPKASPSIPVSALDTTNI
ncbi:hypothetical protein MPER_11977 [Moniliophthora perniciosa FA553]|nr:hypothetical protein MPER_11977 [Moniliophthora perniciosa FA553]